MRCVCALQSPDQVQKYVLYFASVSLSKYEGTLINDGDDNSDAKGTLKGGQIYINCKSSNLCGARRQQNN